MNRSLLLGVAIFFGAVGICLVGDQPQANAGWWHRAANCGGWGWHGGWGPYAAAWSGYGGGCWGGCYGYAPVGWSGCYGWSGCGGWGGCYGWSGGYSSVGYGVADCGGYAYGYSSGYGVADCCGDGIISGGKGEAPGAIQKDGAVDEPTPAPPEGGEAEAVPSTSAQLNLQVPADATVIINNYVTSSTGNVRRYVSRGLQPGTEYQFEIRAEVTRDGAKIERSKVVRVRANESADVAFDFSAPQMASLSR